MDLNLEAVRELLNWLDSSPTECDGFSFLAYAALIEAEVPAKMFAGTFTYLGHEFGVHHWIELETGHMVDYRSHLWISPDPVENIPRGIFKVKDFPGIEYSGISTFDAKESIVKEYILDMRRLFLYSFEMDNHFKEMYGTEFK